ncbi:hypothetical protein LOTGIDRAFT_110141 [Lottia gigantea]|uniref:ABC transporter domain-containing protein n=1 Tax=Lottia gigantea TaxID=225164 RepID=V4B975_LOTGI|nr:hypothetical protein LOTGIDRAFT_110141 [Lottia gigantea]ESP03886.1 hypothetical protein LOTGIDRAFT_110141 [Lottia gigantea]
MILSFQGFFLSVAKGGMTFDTINLGDFPLSGPIIMLAVDAVLYGLLAFYLDRVIPGEYGVRYKPWYFLLPSFWCGDNRKSGELTSLIDNKHVNINEEDKDGDIEMVSTDLENKAALRIFNIRKTFENSDKEDVHAVDGISLDIYQGQITGLLGHNGAGKTTLINMLCGLTPPSQGSAIINNLDITNNNDLEKIRATAGICPQHNILYDDLSCREHLQVFAGIKGVQPNLVKSEIERSLKEVGLTDQAEVYSKDLSGGQKRKLSVAIALIGDPKIIILDEPTAGMDPYSRRQLWSLLKNSKEGKVILLTTHFMDEADILADRKAIISKGQLRCCGSSLFLKSKFGIGYHLNMVVEPEVCKVNEITEILKQNVDGVELQRSHGKELSYTVPMTEIDKFSGKQAFYQDRHKISKI